MIQAEPVDVTDPSSVMRQIQELNQRADMLYRSAVQANDRMNTVRALKELRELLTLYARLTGGTEHATERHTPALARQPGMGFPALRDA